MSQRVLLVASIALVVGAAVLLVALVARFQRVRRLRSQIGWLRHQIARAVDQLGSTDTDEILAGLQTLAMLNDPVVRAAAREQVMRLTNSDDDDVARQAKSTLDRLMGNGWFIESSNSRSSRRN